MPRDDCSHVQYTSDQTVIVTVHNIHFIKHRARLHGSVAVPLVPVGWRTCLLDTAVVFCSVGGWYCRMPYTTFTVHPTITAARKEIQ